MLGWHCGSYAEAHTSAPDRALWGSYSAVVHGAATASWIRILHAKAPATLGFKDFVSEDPAVSHKAFTPDSNEKSNIWISNMGLDGTPCEKTHFDPTEFHLSQYPSGTRLAIYFDAVHPGRDIYLFGAALKRNIRTWYTVGKLLISQSSFVSSTDQGREQGLTPEMAAQVLEAASLIDQGIDEVLLNNLTKRVVGKLVAKGHGHVLARGPHADIMVEVHADSVEVKVEE